VKFLLFILLLRWPYMVRKVISLRGEYKLNVLGNNLLKRIIGIKRYEITVERRNLRSGELHNVHSSPNFTSIMVLGLKTESG
jgi:altronate dehydratase